MAKAGCDGEHSDGSDCEHWLWPAVVPPMPVPGPRLAGGSLQRQGQGKSKQTSIKIKIINSPERGDGKTNSLLRDLGGRRAIFICNITLPPLIFRLVACFIGCSRQSW